MTKRNNYLFLFAFYLMSSSQASFAKDLSIDIGLFDSSIRNYISANKDYSIYALSENGKIEETLIKRTSKEYSLIRFGTEINQKLVIAAAPQLVTSSKTILFSCAQDEPQSDCIWTVKDNKFANRSNQYRGLIIIRPKEKDFTVINRLYLEDYLKGVVPSEMPSSWHKEALKAQSVAARTYTVSKLNRRKNLGYDLKPTVEDQMYLGVNHEKASTNQAIKETAGMILVDQQKKPVEAYFYSSAGFSTASAADVWGTEHHAYLRPQLMSDKTSFWQSNFSLADLNIKLKDLNFTTIKALTILNTTPKGRAKDILISGDKAGELKHIKLTGEELRHKLGLRSTFFDTRVYQKAVGKSNPSENLQRQGLRSDEKLSLLGVNDSSRSERNAAVGDSQIGFIGKGFGHGIGMSQYGAKKLAEQGKLFKEILEFFYAGASLKKI